MKKNDTDWLAVVIVAGMILWFCLLCGTCKIQVEVKSIPADTTEVR